MKLLLDTHALLWALAAPERLSASALSALEESAHELWISSVSFFEIANKVRLGKLQQPGSLLEQWELTVSRLNGRILELSAGQAILAGTFSTLHRDPFDRLLAAQAIDRHLSLVTCDAAFQQFTGLEILW